MGKGRIFFTSQSVLEKSFTQSPATGHSCCLNYFGVRFSVKPENSDLLQLIVGCFVGDLYSPRYPRVGEVFYQEKQSFGVFPEETLVAA